MGIVNKIKDTAFFTNRRDEKTLKNLDRLTKIGFKISGTFDIDKLKEKFKQYRTYENQQIKDISIILNDIDINQINLQNANKRIEIVQKEMKQLKEKKGLLKVFRFARPAYWKMRSKIKSLKKYRKETERVISENYVMLAKIRSDLRDVRNERKLFADDIERFTSERAKEINFISVLSNMDLKLKNSCTPEEWEEINKYKKNIMENNGRWQSMYEVDENGEVKDITIERATNRLFELAKGRHQTKPLKPKRVAETIENTVTRTNKATKQAIKQFPIEKVINDRIDKINETINIARQAGVEEAKIRRLQQMLSELEEAQKSLSVQKEEKEFKEFVTKVNVQGEKLKKLGEMPDTGEEKTNIQRLKDVRGLSQDMQKTVRGLNKKLVRDLGRKIGNSMKEKQGNKYKIVQIRPEVAVEQLLQIVDEGNIEMMRNPKVVEYQSKEEESLEH